MAGSSSILSLGVVLSADASAATKGFKQFQEGVGGSSKAVSDLAERTKKAFGQMAVGGGIFGAGAGGLFAAGKLAAASGEFNSQMTKVGLIAQANAKDLTAMKNAAMDMGLASKFAPMEAAQAIEGLAAAGLNAKESVTALKPVLDLATGGSISAESATQALVAALKVFSLEASDAGSAADKMLAISNATMLSAKDLEQVMGSIGRGASITKQGLGEMLSAAGLVRNTGVDASVAGQSVSSALLHMAESGKKFKALGVNVTDAKGEFRPFMDVVLETEKVLSKRFPDAAERAAKANDLFSKFGLTAYSAITTQLGKGITDAEGKLFQGAAAVQFLRQSMDGATGTAGKFASTMMATWTGQSDRLKALSATAKIAFGESFERLLGPPMKWLTDQFEKLVRWFKDLPQPLKDTISKVALGVGAFVALTGAIIAGVAAFKLLAIGASFLGLGFTGLLTTILPVALAVGALALALSGGKLSGAWDSFPKKISLAFQSITMLFSRGGFTKPLWDDLNKGGNEGVKNFAITVYHWAGVISEFFKGAWAGFKSAIAAAQPVFEAVGQAFWNVGKALGLVTEESSSDAVNRWDRWRTTGEKLGAALGKMAEIVGGALKTALELAAPVIKVFQGWWATLKDEVVKTGESLEGISKRLEDAAGAQNKYGAATGGADDSTRRFWSALKGTGDMILRLGGGLLRGVIDMVEGIGGALNNLAAIFTTSVSHIEGTWNKVFLSMKVIAFNFFSFVMNLFFGVASFFARILDAIGKLKGQDWGFAKGLSEAKTGALDWAKSEMGISWQGGKYYHAGAVPQAPTAYVPWSEAPPAEGAMSLPGAGPAPTAAFSPNANASTEELHRDLQEIKNAIKAGQNTTVNVGGEALLRINKREERSEAISSWDPGVSMAPAE